MDERSIAAWLESLKDGDSRTARQLWERYFTRLAHLAERRLGGLPRRTADEEDIALSAMNSFMQGAREGKFPSLTDETDMWRLLVTITARKVSAQRRRHFAVRRHRGKIRGESVFAAKSGSDAAGGIDAVEGPEPTPEFVAEMSEACRRLFERLNDRTLCDVARWKLEGCTNEEIATRLGRNLRTVERKLKLIRDCWSALD
jgi:DNA-directed RNA polymerase specialized sigma24 family protein